VGSIAWLSKSLFGTSENGKEFVDHCEVGSCFVCSIMLGSFYFAKEFC
jgi:hypothetical protein